MGGTEEDELRSGVECPSPGPRVSYHYTGSGWGARKYSPGKSSLHAFLEGEIRVYQTSGQRSKLLLTR